MVARVTTQDATDFLWVVAKDCITAGIFCFDAFARPTKVFKTSSAAGTSTLVPPSGKPTLTVPGTSTTGSFTASWKPQCQRHLPRKKQGLSHFLRAKCGNF
jgi:hypothetical protein